MTAKTHLARSAGSALAAALALASTPLLAQEAVIVPPVDIAPATATSPAAAPTITVPDIAPATPPPVAQAEPVTAESATPAAPPVSPPAARANVAPPARAAAPAPIETAPVAAPPAVPQSAPLTPETVAPEPAPVAAAAAPIETPRQSNESGTIAAVLGGAAALGLALWGVIALNRRRTPPAARAELEPVPLQSRRAAGIVPSAEPAFAAPVVPPAREPVPLARPAAASLSHGGASVALPREIPASFEERDALLKRMIAAKPDRANPFTSPLQRRKRAKLILQSLGRDFGDAKPWIDFSQYPQNWPGLAQRHYATAA